MDPRPTACQGRRVPRIAALALGLLPSLPLAGCVEIDPSYADSYTTSGSESTTTSPDTDASTAGDSGSSGDPACDCGPWELCEAGVCTAPARILYVNLEGATTVFGVAGRLDGQPQPVPRIRGHLGRLQR